MFGFSKVTDKFSEPEVQKMTNNAADTRITEAQAIFLRKSAAIAILSELVHYYKDCGMERMQVLRHIEEQVSKTLDSLVLPKNMYNDIIQKSMNLAYVPVDRPSRMMATMIEGIREINKEDPGGNDAGMGLPADMKAFVEKMEKWDKVLDETEDLVVEAGGNKFIQTSLATMAHHLPKEFFAVIKK